MRFATIIALAIATLWLGASTSADPVATQPAVKALFPVQVDGRWGFVDVTGTQAIAPRFDRVGAGVGPYKVFASELVPVVLEGKWVYIDKTGKTVVTVPGRAYSRTGNVGRGGGVKRLPEAPAGGPDVHQAGLFSEGMARITVGTIRMGDIGRMTQGFIDRSGKMLIPATYTAARDFRGGLAAVRNGRTWSYVDKTGKVVLDGLDVAGDFAGGKALVRKGRQWGLMDRIGKMVVNFGELQNCRTPADGLVAFGRGGKWGYMDMTGKVVVEPKYAIVEQAADGVALVFDGGYDRQTRKMVGKYAFLSTTTGKPIAARTFDSAYGFTEHLAAAEVNGKWGYLDKNGKLAIAPQFASPSKFTEGLAGVKLNGKVVYIDKTGKVAVTPAGATYGGPFSHGLAVIHLGQYGRGYMDKTGRIVYRWKIPEPDPTQFEG